RNAEATLYARFSARVLFLARRGLNSRERAEEARHTTFARIIDAIRTKPWPPSASLASLVLETTREVVREMARPRRRSGQVPADELWSLHSATVAVDPSVVDAVHGVVQALGPRDRAFLRMYYYDDLSFTAIGQRLGIRPERV